MTKSVRSTPAPFNFNSFQGFAYPNTTQVPDLLFDHIMQDLDEKELKVLLYIIRRTFGFKKSMDNISLNQMVNGITTRDGKILDRGTGLSKATVARALQSLKQKNLINAIQNRDQAKGNLPTTYSLRTSPAPCLTAETRVVSHVKQGLVSRVRHTINSSTTNSSTTAKPDDSTHKNEDLAAALIEKGIDQRATRHLSTQYSRERLLNNLDLFEYILKTSPSTVSKNPAGWLRRAIEQDYAANGRHQGFQTRQQKAAKVAVQKQRLTAQQKQLDAQKSKQRALLQQQQLASRKWLETLRQRYHSTAKEQRLWADVQQDLKTKISPTAFNLYLSQTSLLSVREGQAILAVPNEFIRDRVVKQWGREIANTLEKKVGQPEISLQFLTLDKAGERAE